MRAVNFTELKELAGELLPERTVLSTVAPSFNSLPGGLGGSDGGSSSSAAASGGNGGFGHGGSAVTSACNSNNTPQSQTGLLDLFGGDQQQNSLACVPAANTGSF